LHTPQILRTRSRCRGHFNACRHRRLTKPTAAHHGLGKTYPHATIDHAQKQYVVGAVDTNTIEGFWLIFKRGIVGTLNNVSKKYLHLCVAEVQFRYNNSFNDDIFGTAIEGC
jgi:ISXO2-like transposase domain